MLANRIRGINTFFFFFNFDVNSSHALLPKLPQSYILKMLEDLSSFLCQVQSVHKLLTSGTYLGFDEWRLL